MPPETRVALPSRNTFQNGDTMSTLDLTATHMLTVCRGRCSRECQHGKTRDTPMELDATFRNHPEVHYPSEHGYTAEQARKGASIMCPSCLAAIGGVANGDWEEQRAMIGAWRGFMRVRDYIRGSAMPDPHLDREYAHWPCGWNGSIAYHDQENHAGGNPDEPVPDTVHCPRCKEDFPTLVNWGNHVTEPDVRAELAAMVEAKAARNAA